MVSQEDVLKAIPFDRFLRHRDIATKFGLNTNEAKGAINKSLAALVRWDDVEHDAKKGYRRLR